MVQGESFAQRETAWRGSEGRGDSRTRGQRVLHAAHSQLGKPAGGGRWRDVCGSLLQARGCKYEHRHPDAHPAALQPTSRLRHKHENPPQAGKVPAAAPSAHARPGKPVRRQRAAPTPAHLSPVAPPSVRTCGAHFPRFPSFLTKRPARGGGGISVRAAAVNPRVLGSN